MPVQRNDAKGVGVEPVWNGRSAGYAVRLGLCLLSARRRERRVMLFLPSWVREQRCEGSEYGYNGIGQGEHGQAYLGK